jgi:hypothetical protein
LFWVAISVFVACVDSAVVGVLRGWGVSLIIMIPFVLLVAYKGSFSVVLVLLINLLIFGAVLGSFVGKRVEKKELYSLRKERGKHSVLFP